ncbi:U32 family peptidase [Candidatus Woesearchaeota archaeon]|nr:U32 family peptidase [Candidatus Woesearchaeota archaeon]
MKPELLAPVGDWETLSSAIKAGADAVYFGIKWINMRAGSARNFDITEVKEVMDKLHKNKIRGYLTLNTVIYDHELDKVKRILEEVKKTKVDAVIATDMAIVQMCQERNIEVHISTQLSVANYESIKFFANFSPRIILARECSIDQIKSLKEQIKKDNLNYKGRPIELETFVHGSCRKKYKITDVEDPRREFILDENFILSPKDLCALPILDKLQEAGVDVFKIEGRAKGPEYVYTVTKAYREAIDLISQKKFTQEKALALVKELEKVFNRGFTDNFFLGTPTNDSWTKFYGSAAQEKKVKIGKVTKYYPNLKVAAVLMEEGELKKGDEICFTGQTTGFYKTKVPELRKENKIIVSARKGDEVSFMVQERVRPEDQVFVIQPRNPEEETKQQYENIGIHKPFKFINSRQEKTLSKK